MSSCSHYYYVPESNMIKVSKAGDLKVAGALSPSFVDKSSVSTKLQKYSIQAAYSPLENIAIRANYFKLKEIETFQNLTTRSGQGFIAGGSISYYTHLNKRLLEYNQPSLQYYTLLDISLGLDHGKAINYYMNGGQSSLSFRKTYLQAGINTKKDIIELGIALRGAQIDYYKGQTSGNIQEFELQDIIIIENKDPFYLLELSGRFSIAFKYFSVYSTANLSLTTNTGLAYRPFILQTGVLLNIDEFFFKQLSFNRKRKKSDSE